MKRQLKRPKILIGVLVTLALILSMFGTAVPVMAADVALTKGVDPTTPNIYRLGDTIHYTMSIMNFSNVTGANEDVVVEAVWDVLPDGSTVYPTGPVLPYTLTPGASQAYTYDWVATVTGTVVDTFHASGYQISTGGNDNFNLSVEKSSVVIDPAIDIEKSTNGQDADSPTGPNIPVGGLVIWEYVITNPGDSPLSNIIVTDSEGGVTPLYVTGDDGDNILQTTETWIYQAGGTAVAGQYANMGYVTGTPLVGPDVSDEDPSHYLASQACIHIEKSTNGDDADNPTGPEIPVGDAVLWEYVVTNCGDVPLSNVKVIDNNGTKGDTSDNWHPTLISGDDGDNILQTTETWIYQANGTALAGQYANNSRAIGTPSVGPDVSDDDPSHYFGSVPCTGSIEILKQDDAGMPLGGACFNIDPNPYGPGTLLVCDNDPNDADQTTTGRILLISVPPVEGGYDIDEDQPPPGGYVKDPDVEHVDVICDTLASASFTNSKEDECTGCLTICKYEDKNGNHEKDRDEPYLSGWQFEVTNADGYYQLVTTGEDDKCCYCCDYCVTIWDLAEGEYTVIEIPQDGWTNTDPEDGSYKKMVYVPCLDGGDLDYSCGGCEPSPDCPTVVEFGNQRECTGCLKICKYEDKNGNGEKDKDEPYLSGWDFEVTGPKDYYNLVTTGEDDKCYCGCDYCVTICDLIPGEYTIIEVTALPDGWKNTDPEDGSGKKTATVECYKTAKVYFGNQGPCSGCLQIYKYNDKNGNGKRDWWYEWGLANWEFTVIDYEGNEYQVTTNRYGYVKICGLAVGECTIKETLKDGWKNTDPGEGYDTAEVKCGETTFVDFGNQPESDGGCI